MQGYLVLCVLLILGFLGQGSVYAGDARATGNEPGGPPLQELFAETDKKLLLALVKLARFNIHLQLETNRHQKWRSLTYPLGRESGTALTFAATLMDLRQQAKGLDSPARISRNELKKAVTCGLIGNAVSGGSSALELAQNTWVMLRAKEKGYSPKSSVVFVKKIVADTDRLLEIRQQLSAYEPSDEKRRITDLETKLVRRIRQQLLFEFCNWSRHSRDQAWRENTFYTLDSMQNFTRMSAAIMAMRAFGHPELARPSVVCALVSNSLATLNPIVSSCAGIAIRKHQEHRLTEELLFERPSTPSPELDLLLKKLSLEKHEDWLQKVVALTTRTELLDTELNRETREIERYRQVAQQQTISGPLIGLTGVASSILAAVAIYGYRRDLDTANKLGFAGRLTHGTGQAYALLNTPYTISSGMIRNRKLRKRGELPIQVLEERLERLARY
jgi:hypothetical protein